jgi:hypothetical protein
MYCTGTLMRASGPIPAHVASPCISLSASPDISLSRATIDSVTTELCVPWSCESLQVEYPRVHAEVRLSSIIAPTPLPCDDDYVISQSRSPSTTSNLGQSVFDAIIRFYALSPGLPFGAHLNRCTERSHLDFRLPQCRNSRLSRLIFLRPTS